jgi:hypothetical protein
MFGTPLRRVGQSKIDVKVTLGMEDLRMDGEDVLKRTGEKTGETMTR